MEDYAFHDAPPQKLSIFRGHVAVPAVVFGNGDRAKIQIPETVETLQNCGIL